MALATAMCLWLGISIAIGWYAAWTQARASAHWPKTSGTMIIGEIDRQPYGNDSYTLRFRYEFNVGGSRYEGTQITAGDAVDTRRFGEFRNLYRAGNTVAVYYDPSNPGRSVLEPGLTTTHWVLAFGAPTLLGMAFIFGWAAVRVGH